MISIKQLNQATPEQATLMLDGVYEHSPWIAANALSQRPFRSLAHLKYCLVQSLEAAGRDAKLGLIRAHPELAGKAMQSNTLTAESTNEQNKAGSVSYTHLTLPTIYPV